MKYLDQFLFIYINSLNIAIICKFGIIKEILSSILIFEKSRYRTINNSSYK